MATRFKQNRVKENPAAVSRWRLMKFLTVCIVVAIVFSSPQIKCARKRMVRLCIASVDPAKLSSQCVMCDRYEFALAVIECAGMTQVKELISNPLSVQEATCLIMHCRQQVPGVQPEPYHGSVSSAIRTNYPVTSGSRIHEMTPPTAMLGGFPGSPYMTRYGLGGYSGATAPQAIAIAQPSASSLPTYLSASRGLVGGQNLPMNGQQLLPYAIVPAPYTSIFGSRKYKAALVPLFSRRIDILK